MTDKIKVFTTGGTIDCHEVDSAGNYSFVGSYIPKMLDQAGNKAEIDIKEIMSKDSLLMNDDDREIIAERCRTSPEDKIIITHGTDTMSETAKYLGEHIKEKTVVLTGAMIPYNKEKSDAMFNLGTAISNVQLLPKGVYISMNGKVFNWNNVKKNIKLGVFEKIN